MDTGNNPPFISAFEAFNILKEHKSITNDAIRAIFSKCNVPINKVTICRFQRKFKKVVAARKNAIRLRKLNEWSVDAKNENFCTYLPQENEDVNREESSSDSDCSKVHGEGIWRQFYYFRKGALIQVMLNIA